MLKQLFVLVAYLRCVGTPSISQMSRLHPLGEMASARGTAAKKRRIKTNVFIIENPNTDWH
ncbi:hypothetical protein D0T56_14795 [Dysgonomonas sp. 520]|nr:hypothetical protein [Dysgonomonas sp. 520]